jgi:HJR/Mrr/RecB family endonuclease
MISILFVFVAIVITILFKVAEMREESRKQNEANKRKAILSEHDYSQWDRFGVVDKAIEKYLERKLETSYVIEICKAMIFKDVEVICELIKVEMKSVCEQTLDDWLVSEVAEKLYSAARERACSLVKMKSFDNCSSVSEIALCISHALSGIDAVSKKVSSALVEAKDLTRLLASGNADVHSMSGEEFEDLIAEVYRRDGYRVEKTPRTGDHGVDLMAMKDGKRLAIQCKRYGNENKVSNTDVLKLRGAKEMKNYRATELLLITTSKLTKKAIEACRECGVEWLEGERTFSLIANSGIYQVGNELKRDVLKIEEQYAKILEIQSSRDFHQALLFLKSIPQIELSVSDCCGRVVQKCSDALASTTESSQNSYKPKKSYSRNR